jgi:hypothetical protein
MSRRDDAIVAWHEVPGRAPPQKIRPVGYGVILAGLQVYARIDRERLWPYMGGIAKQNGTIPMGLAAPDHTVPYGTVLWRTLSQAPRLRSVRPYGDCRT